MMSHQNQAQTVMLIIYLLRIMNFTQFLPAFVYSITKIDNQTFKITQKFIVLNV